MAEQQSAPMARRVTLAAQIVEREQTVLGRHFLAAACYGSVAHGKAGEDSDLELIILTDDSVPAEDHHFREQGLLVESDRLPASRFHQAAGRVTEDWGIEADSYRHHLVIEDPRGLFAEASRIALTIPPERFWDMLARTWWDAEEGFAKVRAMVRRGDRPGLLFTGWQFLWRAAMRVALHDQRPYESLRTLWGDVAARGYGFLEVLAGIRGGDAGWPDRLTAVKTATGSWGRPQHPADRFIIPKP
jgi:predicted nucleotidyltransferase